MRCMNRDNPSAKLEDGLREVAIRVLLAVMETVTMADFNFQICNAADTM